MKILLVEDEKRMAQALCQILRLEKYEVDQLEFDEVIVPGVSNMQYDADYDRNLLYIACTRAMHKLTLTYTGSPSRFLPGL